MSEGQPQKRRAIALIGTGYVADFYMRSIRLYPEVEIVGKDRIAMVQGPGHQVAIRSAWIAHLRPMHRLVPGCLKERDPLSRQVHIDQKPRHQVSTSASSRSSRRQAA